MMEASMRVVVVFFVLLLSLAACASKPQMAFEDDATCRSYGLSPPSPAYADCRMRLTKLRDARRRAGLLALPRMGFGLAAADAVVAPVHSKAMPVLLTTPAEQDAWPTAPLEEAPKLHRPLPDDALRLVAMVKKADEWVPAAAAE
jgi:hypothetical protein